MEGRGVKEESTRGIGNFADMDILLDSTQEVLFLYKDGVTREKEVVLTNICNPRLDSAKEEVIRFMGLVNIRVVVDHPSQLDGGKVGGQGESRTGRKDIICNRKKMIGGNRTYMLLRVSIPSWPFFQTPGETWMPVSLSLVSKCATVFLVRESAQTMALQRGLPVLRLQATVVSRWFVTPRKEKRRSCQMTCSQLSCDGDGDGEERTDGFDTLLRPSGSLERAGGLFDTLIDVFLDLIGVVFMPSGSAMSGKGTKMRKAHEPRMWVILGELDLVLS